MKKLIPVLLVCLMLSGCNYPTTELSSEEVVQTNVALILTNAPETTLLPDPTQDTETPEATAEVPTEVVSEPTAEAPTEVVSEPTNTETAVPTAEPQPTSTDIPEPTATDIPEPTATDIPEPTATDIPEPTATETPEPTATATAAPTATPEPVAGDPVVQFGKPDFLEDFAEAGNWPYEDDWFLITVSGGQLHAFSKGSPYWSSWYTTYPEVKDAYFETTITRPNCSGQDRFGLVIRWDEAQEFYYMGVTCDGTWGFSFYTKDNQIINILDYQTSNALKPAIEANRIGIMAKGDQFDFYINGIKVGSATDDRLDDAGTFGFISMSAGTVNFKTSVDKLEYWQQ